MQVKEFEQFKLVGGTSLALRRGYRNSVDIDLFTETRFDPIIIGNIISNQFKGQLLVSYSFMLQYIVNEVKIDFVNNGLSEVYPIEKIGNIRISSELDVAALKLNAVCGRGAKKDFIDIYVLLQHYSLAELLAVFKKKIPRTDLGIVLKSLLYFEDAEHDKMPELFIKLSWQEIKLGIEKKVKQYFIANS